MTQEAKLTTNEIETILVDIENEKYNDKLSQKIPMYPKENEIFYYVCKDLRDRDYRRDGYFYNKPSVTKLKNIIRTYSSVCRDGITFKRIVDKLISPKNPNRQSIVIRYSGNSNACVKRPHGNSKYTTKDYSPTSSTVKKYIQSKFDPLTVNPNQLIHRELFSSARDLKQVQNFTYAENKKLKIYNCPLKSVCEIAKHSDIIWHLTLFPDIIIVVGNFELLELANKVIAQGELVILEYDTTFNLGNFYLSYIVCQRKFPIAFLIHTKKYESVHIEFWKIISGKIESFNNVVIASDREPAIVKAISTVLPNVKQVFCYNHILRNVRKWLEKHIPKNVAEICKEVSLLLYTANVNEYQLEIKKTDWPKEFRKYYFNNIHQDVLSNKNIIPSTYITTNGIERYNRTIKDWCNHKEQDIDRMVLLLEWLQTFIVQQQISNELPVYNLTELILKYKNVESKIFENEFRDSDFDINTIAQLCHCEYDSNTNVFTVKHPFNETVNGVWLKNNSFVCTCGSTLKCIHLSAVELIAGENRSKFSKRLLVQNKLEGKSGRKKPRKVDKETN